MPKAYLKFVQKSAYRIKLISLIEDLAENNLNAYDLVKMKGYDARYRIRIGDVRCVFEKREGENYVLEIDNRGDIY